MTLCPKGNGIFYDDNGSFYEGEWWDGKRHGRGRAVYGGREVDGSGGDAYEGNWENDFRYYPHWHHHPDRSNTESM